MFRSTFRFPSLNQDGGAGSSTGNGSGSAAASSAGSSAGTSGSQPSGQAAPAQGAAAAAGTGQAQPTGQTAGASGAGAQGQPTGQGTGTTEDRSKWIPPHRFRDLNRTTQNQARQIEQMRQQLAALTGVAPPQAQPTRRLPQGVTEEDIEQAREHFALVYPHLANVSPEDMTTLLEFAKTGIPQTQEMQQRHWKQLGSQSIRALSAEVKTQIGALTDKGMGKIMGAFHQHLQSDPDAFERWEAGDPTLITDFVADWKAEFEGYYTQRTAAGAGSTVAAARRLPRGGSSSAVVPSGQAGEPALDPADEDAVHKRAFSRMARNRQANQPAA